jgi:hypothetical protein
MTSASVSPSLLDEPVLSWAERILAAEERLAGAEVGRHEGSDLTCYAKYTDDPVGFIRDVLHGDPWSAQEEIAAAVQEAPLVAVRSAHACGKDWLAARLALWTFATGRKSILTAPTHRQVTQVLMSELRRAWDASDLPGEMHQAGLRLPGDPEYRILAFVSSDAPKFSGFHWPAGLLVILDEAEDIEAEVYESMLGNVTGARDRLLAIGNPLDATGKFYEICRPHSAWRKIKIRADESPNVIAGREVIPGLITREGIARFRQEYGEDSGPWCSRILAEFPTGPALDSVMEPAWLERAAAQHEARTLHNNEARYKIALDPARHGPDSSCVCVMRGNVVERFVQWRALDTMQLCGRLIELLREFRIYPEPHDDLPRHDDTGLAANDGTVIVDEVGLGAGVVDRLKELRYPVRAFNSSRKARDAQRYLNARAEAFWTLRQKLQKGQLAMARNGDAIEELLALRYDTNSAGRIQIISKPELRARLGRSPDFADSLAMAVSGGSQISYFGAQADW